jgi:predicted GIY-YIG superfamily endonuclease
MRYVYLLRSLRAPDRRYIGSTDDLPRRLAEHNAGKSASTAPFAPWRLVTAIAFEDDSRAIAFERYLKSGSGAEFARRQLW